MALSAKVFYEQRKAPDQIAQTVRAILNAPEFRSTWGQKIKRPLEVGASVLRALDTDLENSEDNLWLFAWMGQPLFGHKLPDGFPDRRESWSSTTHMFRRWQFGIGASSGWFDKIKKVDWLKVTPTRKPNEIVDFWTKRVLGQAVSAPTRQQILKFLTWGEDANKPLEDKVFAERVPLAVGMIFAIIGDECVWRMAYRPSLIAYRKESLAIGDPQRDKPCRPDVTF
ncbi:MAG TPA: DUF1800 family protein [Meiothermus sp.]|nr:DUF1800 family protein [Meiothermus sp.]